MVSHSANNVILRDAIRWLRRATKKHRKYHHIFRGEVRRVGPHRTWTAQGLHHRYLGHNMPDRRVGPILRHDYNGAYAAEVSMKGPNGWIAKRGGSTFFPDHWTPQKVVAAIEEAFARRTNAPGRAARRWRGWAHGVPIEGSYDARGAWDSAWPVLPPIGSVPFPR
jgi:hypothetical protein